MTGIYFSGTGNTKYAVETFLKYTDPSAAAYSIEDSSLPALIAKEEEIVFGYPVQFSNLPKIVSDYIHINHRLWIGKQIFLIATMGLFSGDGTGTAGRPLHKYGAVLTGGLHLKMPDSIADEKALKRPFEKNCLLVRQAEYKIQESAKQYCSGRPSKEGLGLWYHLAGLFGQRLYFIRKTSKYSSRLHINSKSCAGCGKCAVLCPMKNIEIRNGKAVSGSQCTMCYRCINECPRQSITLLGKRIITQGKLENYL